MGQKYIKSEIEVVIEDIGREEGLCICRLKLTSASKNRTYIITSLDICIYIYVNIYITDKQYVSSFSRRELYRLYKCSDLFWWKH